MLDDEPLLSPQEVAEWIGVPERTLKRLRAVGGGPEFLRTGDAPNGRVYYSRRAVLRYLKERTNRHAGGGA